MLQPGKMITITRRLDALHREHPSLEDAIKEAEGRFRDLELEQDWRSQPIEQDGGAEEMRSPPPCWKAGIDLAAPIAVAYAKAQLGTAPDPATFERFTEDVIAVVAQNTFFSKLSEYMRNPHSISSLVVDQFIADVRAATRTAMKRLHRDAWRQGKRISKPQSQSVSGARSPQSENCQPARKMKKVPTRRRPLPNVAELIAGKEFISPEHAIEWFRTSDRNLRKLIEKRRIEVRGEGQNRQISVASLRRYFAV
jgi:hypothetical protein